MPDELTGQQSVSVTYGEDLATSMAATYATYRTLRTQPTIALARALSIAPIVAGEWSVATENDAPEGAEEFISRQLLNLRPIIMEQALLAGIDFGWAAWEKVFDTKDGLVCLRKLKLLLQDITTILIDGKTGAFAGFKQRMEKLPLENCLLVPWRVEGTNWYGVPLLENIRTAYTNWSGIETSAARYDNKVAGATFVVRYPPGDTVLDGTVTDNHVTAKAILDALESSGGVVIPQETQEQVEQLGFGWKIELLSDTNPKQPSFLSRLEYIDKLFSRGLLWPERAIMEGKYGTRAEASVHTDSALTNAELMAQHVTRHINWYVVDQLLALNWGDEARGTVMLEDSPILDPQIEFMREIFLTAMKDPAGFAMLLQQLDFKALIQRLGLPYTGEEIEALEPHLADLFRKLAEPQAA